MFGITTLLFVKDLLKEGHSFLLKVILHGGKVDPTADGLSVQVQIVRFEALVNHLTCLFELTDMPHERRCRYQVAIVRHLFTLVHRQHKRVNRFLVDVAAPFMVEYQRLSRRILHLSTVLDARELANGFIDVTFVKDSVGFPENQYGVRTFFQLLQSHRKCHAGVRMSSWQFRQIHLLRHREF